MLIYTILKNHNITINSQNMELIESIIAREDICETFYLQNFDLHKQAKLLNIIYNIIPANQHKDLYEGLLNYLKNIIDVENFNINVIKLLFMPAFVMKYYAKSLSGDRFFISEYPEYENYYNNQEFIHKLQNIKTNEIIESYNLELYSRNSIIKIKNNYYNLLDITNNSPIIKEYIVYTFMTEATEDVLHTIKNSIIESQVTNAEYILFLFRQQIKAMNISKTTITEDNTSIQNQNDLYCIHNDSSSIIIVQYDKQYRVIIPIQERYSIKKSTYQLPNNLNPNILLKI